MKTHSFYLWATRLVQDILANSARRAAPRFVLVVAQLAAASLLLGQSPLDNMSQAEVLNKLRKINAQVTSRVIEHGSPEGAFLEAVGNHRPLSPDVIEQLIVMVDIQFKPTSRAERDLTTHSPCASALAVGLTDPLPVIEAALQRPGLPPAVKPVLLELKKRIEMAATARARTAERKKQDAETMKHPGAQQEKQILPPSDQWPFPRVVNKPRTETKPPEALPTITPPRVESTSSTPWSIIAVLIIAAIGLLCLLAKKRK